MSDDDNDLGETFRAMADMSKAKRAANRDSSPRILEEAGISFSAHNEGAHLVVSSAFETIDFWPGTGLWISRMRGTGTWNTRRDGKGKRGRGVHNLIKRLKGEG